MANRMEVLESRNGVHKGKLARKPGKSGAAAKRSRALKQVERWASRYVLAAVVLSAGLNAWANADLCPTVGLGHQLAAALIGAVVPCLVWLTGKVAGWSHRAGRRGLSVLVGLAGVCLLLLSVAHCAHAIEELTGSGLLLSILLAVGIDYGLVASECAAIVAHNDE